MLLEGSRGGIGPGGLGGQRGAIRNNEDEGVWLFSETRSRGGTLARDWRPDRKTLPPSMTTWGTCRGVIPFL
jgi:hypothetical protein